MFKKILSTTATRILTAFISLIVLWLNASELGPSGIATISVIILGVSITSLINGLLGSSSLSYFVSRKPLGKLIGISYLSILGGSLLLLLIAYLLKDSPRLYFRIFLTKEFQYHILILAILQSIYANHMAVLIGKEKIFMHNLLTLSQFMSLIILLGSLFYTQEEPNVYHYLVAYYTSIILPLLISSFYIIKWIIQEPKNISSKGLLKEVFDFGWAVQAASLVQMFNYRLYYYFLNTPSGKSNLGVFTTANQLSEGLWIFGKSVSMVQYSRIANSTDKDYNQNLTLRLFKFTSIITVFALVVVLLIPGKVFVSLLKHEEFIQIPQIILLLSPGIVALVAKMIFAHYFSGTGRPKINLVASLISLVIAIISASTLIPQYGIHGAALSASITYTVGALILFILFKKESNLRFIYFLPNRSDITFLKSFIQEFRQSR